MAEYFGAAAASVALLTQLTQCGIAIHKAVKRIKSSRSDIAELADETILFAGLCDDFSRVWAGERTKSRRRNSSVKLLDIWIKKTLKGLRKVLRTVNALRIEKWYSSLEETLIAYLEWFFSKSLVERLRANMAVARQSVEGFSTLLCIRKLNEELEMLRHALTRPSEREKIEKELGMTIENKIDLLQQTVEIKHSVHRTSARQLRAATDDIAQKNSSHRTSDLMPAPTELFDLTASLDTFADEVLTPRQASRRKNRSRASSNLSSSPQPWLSSSQNLSPPETSRTIFSMSTISSDSIRTPINESRPATSASVLHDETLGPSRPTVKEPTNSSGMTADHRDTRAREYINDPEGSILSPPKLKTHDTVHPKSKRARIGRHVVGLTNTEFTLNGYSLPVGDYEHAQTFYQTVTDAPEYLDSLDEALARGSEDWCGIPDWIVNPSDVTTRAAAAGVRDV